MYFWRLTGDLAGNPSRSIPESFAVVQHNAPTVWIFERLAAFPPVGVFRFNRETAALPHAIQRIAKHSCVWNVEQEQIVLCWRINTGPDTLSLSTLESFRSMVFFGEFSIRELHFCHAARSVSSRAKTLLGGYLLVAKLGIQIQPP
jgi:hypothetical protein